MLSKIKSLIIITLIIYLSYLVSIITWQIFAQEDRQIPIIENEAVISTNPVPQNLFGVEVKAQPKKNYTKVKKTKLDVKLIGIINRKQNPVAIIALASGLNKVYKVGDKINGLAEIKEIENNFIIIKNKNKYEKLLIERKTTDNLVKTVEKTKKVAEKPKQIIKINNNHKRTLRNYLSKARTNPASLLSVVRIEPNFVSGLLSGFKIYPAQERELFAEIGFKAGDIITQINGVKMDNLANAFNIGKDLAREKTFDFVILRNNTEQYIYFDLN
jgi:general secretion pathway protein C